MKKFLEKHTCNLSEKTVAISGATGGLGKALCYLLAENGADIILIDRNKEKQSTLISELITAFPKLNIEGLVADMEDFESVKELADKLKKRPIHTLILNAGAYSIPRHKTSLGYDNVFQINFVSPYYLTKELLPHIKNNSGKIIAVGSIAHTYSKTDKSDIDFSKRKRASLVYGNAKRHLMYAFFALAEKGEPCVIAHPGITFTGITAHYPKPIFAIIKHPMKVIFMKPKKACLSIYYAIFKTPKPFFWIGPRFFNVWGLPKINKVKEASEQEKKYIAGIADSIYSSIS